MRHSLSLITLQWHVEVKLKHCNPVEHFQLAISYFSQKTQHLTEVHTTSSSIKRNCTWNVSRESTPNSRAQRKRKKLLQTNMKQH